MPLWDFWNFQVKKGDFQISTLDATPHFFGICPPTRSVPKTPLTLFIDRLSIITAPYVVTEISYL
jgi:hypothetical protein